MSPILTEAQIEALATELANLAALGSGLEPDPNLVESFTRLLKRRLRRGGMPLRRWRIND